GRLLRGLGVRLAVLALGLLAGRSGREQLGTQAREIDQRAGDHVLAVGSGPRRAVGGAGAAAGEAPPLGGPHVRLEALARLAPLDHGSQLGAVVRDLQDAAVLGGLPAELESGG